MDLPDLASNQLSGLNSVFTDCLCLYGNSKKHGFGKALHVSSGVFCTFQVEKIELLLLMLWTSPPPASRCATLRCLRNR